MPVEISGNITGLKTENLDSNASIVRSQLAQDGLQECGIPLTSLRVWDAWQTVLPSAASADDLGVVTGTWATDTPTLQSSDGKATTITQYTGFEFTLPPEYDNSQDMKIRVTAGMLTTVSDGTATIDLECYQGNGFGGITGSDLCQTSAISVNSLSQSNNDFTIDAAGASLQTGDILFFRLTAAITDTATGTAVIIKAGQISAMLDIRG